MVSTVRDPLPLPAVRDLLGLVRVLYASRVTRGAPAAELQPLAKIGADLVLALDMASKFQPGTLGHKAAWGRVEDAVVELKALVGEGDTGAGLLAAGAARAVRRSYLRKS